MSTEAKAEARHRLWLVANVAVVIVILAYVSPVEDPNSDGAVALLGSQALLEHSTLAIDAYAGPDLAYVLDGDYRIRRYRHGGHYYFSFGTPIFSTPFVWLANRLGLHMADQEDEFWTQNFISALLSGALFLLLYGLARTFLPHRASLVLALVSSLGSPLVSTLATALWNVGFAVLFMGGALLVLLRFRPLGVVGWLVVSLFSSAAFLCRPTAGFFVLGLVAYLLLERRRPSSWIAGIGLVLAAVVGLLLLFDAQGWIVGYYSPRKLIAQASPLIGLFGLLLSPSRGLFVFSPFLFAVAAGVVLRFRSLRRQSLSWLAFVWIGSQLAALSLREVWWGGHAFGPRMLAELFLPITLLACLVWRDRSELSPRTRRRLASAYLVLAVPALAIHLGQGLWNPQTLRWNKVPNIDDYPEYLFSWRYPQFLASSDQIDRRWTEIRIAELPSYEIGTRLPFDTGSALFLNWYPPEPGGRWSQRTSEIVFRPRAVDAEALYLLQVEGTTLTPQEVGVVVNGAPVGRLGLGPERRQQNLVAVAGRDLAKSPNATVRFEVPELSTAEEDPRLLGLRLVGLELEKWEEGAAVDFDDEPFFGSGWSSAEAGWRWSDGHTALLRYPTSEASAAEYHLRLEASGLGPQPVTFVLDGNEIGTVEIDTQETYEIRFPGHLLLANRVNEVRLLLPGARKVPPDPRLLGVRLISLQIEPLPGGPLPVSVRRPSTPPAVDGHHRLVPDDAAIVGAVPLPAEAIRAEGAVDGALQRLSVAVDEDHDRPPLRVLAEGGLAELEAGAVEGALPASDPALPGRVVGAQVRTVDEGLTVRPVGSILLEHHVTIERPAHAPRGLEVAGRPFLAPAPGTPPVAEQEGEALDVGWGRGRRRHRLLHPGSGPGSPEGQPSSQQQSPTARISPCHTEFSGVVRRV